MGKEKKEKKPCENCGKKEAKNTNVNVWLCNECYWMAKKEFPNLDE